MDEKDYNNQTPEAPDTNQSSPVNQSNVDPKVLVGVGLVMLVMLIMLVAIYVAISRSNNPSAPKSVAPEVAPEVVAEKLVLPESWPESVPVAEDATKTDVVLDTFAPASSTVTFSTKDTPQEVIASYVTKFEAEGGVVEALGSTPTKEIFSGRTADDLIYVVYAGEVNGETIVTINVNPAQ